MYQTIAKCKIAAIKKKWFIMIINSPIKVDENLLSSLKSALIIAVKLARSMKFWKHFKCCKKNNSFLVTSSNKTRLCQWNDLFFVSISRQHRTKKTPPKETNPLNYKAINNKFLPSLKRKLSKANKKKIIYQMCIIVVLNEEKIDWKSPQTLNSLNIIF